MASESFELNLSLGGGLIPGKVVIWWVGIAVFMGLQLGFGHYHNVISFGSGITSSPVF